MMWRTFNTEGLIHSYLWKQGIFYAEWPDFLNGSFWVFLYCFVSYKSDQKCFTFFFVIVYSYSTNPLIKIKQNWKEILKGNGNTPQREEIVYFSFIDDVTEENALGYSIKISKNFNKAYIINTSSSLLHFPGH